ncbi:hypothetical protein Taro_011044 [Colocasia esculenta]|uniref:Uncharacterized protein n=1 Tax=Colocasia esculenta TaxID=4460 RepID=A0A843U596_COLES|nr:hypothetical protein [Colocasia esculenta]
MRVLQVFVMLKRKRLSLRMIDLHLHPLWKYVC